MPYFKILRNLLEISKILSSYFTLEYLKFLTLLYPVINSSYIVYNKKSHRKFE